MAQQLARHHEIRQRVIGELTASRDKFILSQLKPPSEGQLRALEHNPILRVRVMKDFGNADLFHAWLKMQ